jgi:hypothetical protein
MKRTTTILFALLLAAGVMAQDDEMGGLGIHVGYASPTLRINSPSSKKLENIAMNGVKIGLSYDASIVKGFGSTLGLNYTFATYHSKWTYISEMSTDQARYRGNYHGLEIFCDWQYKFQIAGNTYLMLYTGPSIQVHLSLKEYEYIRTAEGVFPVDADAPGAYYGYTHRDNHDGEDFKRVNVTWGIGAGFQYKRYFIRGGYDFGLFNPYKKDTFKAMGIDSELYTRGRFDQWQIKIGMYIWQN